MSRSADRTMTRSNPGVGVSLTTVCMGCNKRRPMLGGKGVGVRWRCIHCREGKARAAA